MSKLTVLHINIIGIVVGLLLAGILWYMLIKPKNEDLDTTQQSVKSTQDAGGTDAAIAAKDKELKKTQADAVQTKAKWSVNEVKYMPPFPYNDKTNDLELYFFPSVGKSSKGQLYGFRDIPTVWGQWITGWYDAQRNSGVSRLPGTEFPIKEFNADPNQLTAALNNHLTFPEDGKPWPVKLECKTFNDALAHLRRFNSMEKHGMPVINNVALSGQTPNLVLAYDLALYIIPRSKPPVREPMIDATNLGGAGAPAAGAVPTPTLGGGGGKGAISPAGGPAGSSSSKAD